MPALRSRLMPPFLPMTRARTHTSFYPHKVQIFIPDVGYRGGGRTTGF
jgi:hypothetical protein